MAVSPQTSPLADGERLRVGRKVGRTLYAHTADNIDGRLIGLVDNPELAELICTAVNAYLDREDQP